MCRKGNANNTADKMCRKGNDNNPADKMCRKGNAKLEVNVYGLKYEGNAHFQYKMKI